jgi:hypothetical protein
VYTCSAFFVMFLVNAYISVAHIFLMMSSN